MIRIAAGLQISAVGRWTMSEQIWKMSEQIRILIGHDVRPNKIYCLMKKFCFIMFERETALFGKESLISFRVIQSTGSIMVEFSTIYNTHGTIQHNFHSVQVIVQYY